MKVRKRGTQEEGHQKADGGGKPQMKKRDAKETGAKRPTDEKTF